MVVPMVQSKDLEDDQAVIVLSSEIDIKNFTLDILDRKGNKKKISSKNQISYC